MIEEYLYNLKELESRANDHALGFSDWLGKRLVDTAQTMVNMRMSDNDYIKLCELFYRKYRHDHDRNSNDPKYEEAMRFCIYRIQQLIEYKRLKSYRSVFPLLSFSRSVDTETKEFIQRKRPMYAQMQNDFKKKMVKIALFITVILMALFVLLFNMHFLIGWILSVFIGVLFYFVAIQYGFVRIFEDKMDKMLENLDEVHQEIDRGLRNY